LKMKFEEQFPSLKGNECKYCRSPDVSLSFSIPEHWVGRLFDSEKIQEHCLDKQRVRDLIGKLEERRTGLFSDRNWPDIMRAELGLEKKYIMGADFAKGKDKTTKGNFK